MEGKRKGVEGLPVVRWRPHTGDLNGIAKGSKSYRGCDSWPVQSRCAGHWAARSRLRETGFALAESHLPRAGGQKPCCLIAYSKVRMTLRTPRAL